MDIQKLKYFISVAKHLNFTRAAEECYIAQTAMSRYIATMEKTLGVTLFVRNNRSVSLTPAGKAFYKDAQEIYDKYMESVDRARKIASGYEGDIVIGYSQLGKTLVKKAMEIFEDQFPKIEIKVEQEPHKEMLEKLRTGKVDIAFGLSTRLINQDDIEEKTLLMETMKIAASRNHPLASKKNISYSRLNDEIIISASEQRDTKYIERVYSLCEDFGFEPQDVVLVGSNETKKLLIETGKGIGFQPAFTQPYLGDDIIFLDMDETTKKSEKLLCFSVARYVFSKNQTAKAFFDMLNEMTFQ